MLGEYCEGEAEKGAREGRAVTASQGWGWREAQDGPGGGRGPAPPTPFSSPIALFQVEKQQPCPPSTGPRTAETGGLQSQSPVSALGWGELACGSQQPLHQGVVVSSGEIVNRSPA